MFTKIHYKLPQIDSGPYFPLVFPGFGFSHTNTHVPTHIHRVTDRIGGGRIKPIRYFPLDDHRSR